MGQTCVDTGLNWLAHSRQHLDNRQSQRAAGSRSSGVVVAKAALDSKLAPTHPKSKIIPRSPAARRSDIRWRWIPRKPKWSTNNELTSCPALLMVATVNEIRGANQAHHSGYRYPAALGASERCAPENSCSGCSGSAGCSGSGSGANMCHVC